MKLILIIDYLFLQRFINSFYLSANKEKEYKKRRLCNQIRKPSVDEILKKYGSKIEGEIKTTELGAVKDSKAYLKFKEERVGEFTPYERWCNTLEVL